MNYFLLLHLSVPFITAALSLFFIAFEWVWTAFFFCSFSFPWPFLQAAPSFLSLVGKSVHKLKIHLEAKKIESDTKENWRKITEHVTLNCKERKRGRTKRESIRERDKMQQAVETEQTQWIQR
jgi:hypothetical protein